MARKRMPPKLNHVQVLILDIIRSHERVSGPEIREELEDYKEEKTGPNFYQMMSRLEKSDLVAGEYGSFQWQGKFFRERFYKITFQGAEALNTTWEFYANLMQPKSV